jgi:hypothetical protein
MEQQDLLVVKLEVISTLIKRLEQQDLLMVKLEVICTSYYQYVLLFHSFYWGVYHLQFDHQ